MKKFRDPSSKPRSDTGDPAGANALEDHLKAEETRQRLVRWLLPALAGSLLFNAVTLILAISLLFRDVEERYFLLPPYKADAEPLVPLLQPLTYERVAFWANAVINRLFDFSHVGIEDHFRDMNIYFTRAGFILFRRDLTGNNWLKEMRERNAVLYGDVIKPLKVSRVGPTFWELKGKVVIRMDAPGYKPSSDEKSVMVRVVKGESTTPVIAPDHPFPPTNFLGLRIEYVELR